MKGMFNEHAFHCLQSINRPLSTKEHRALGRAPTGELLRIFLRKIVCCKLSLLFGLEIPVIRIDDDGNNAAGWYVVCQVRHQVIGEIRKSGIVSDDHDAIESSILF